MPQTTKIPRRRKTPLSSERISAVAMDLVDEEGLDALSFRTLAKRLNCEAMSLYHYYPSKQHLVDALVSTCLPETHVPQKGTPREHMEGLCLNYRATAIRHAGMAPYLFIHRLNHREGLDWLNRVAAIFDDSPAPVATKARVFRVISYFLTGDEAQRDFPSIVAFGAHFGKENHLAFFETGLNLLLDWMERELATAVPAPD